jgi:serine/threonine protein kinase
MAKVRFGSVAAMLTAAMQICEGFEQLHRKGYSYQDLNDGNFFINPITGQVLICDNDNVSAAGSDSGILGKARYMAPEVVMGRKNPDKWTDLFSLAVTLFLLFYNNHPLEGITTTRIPCMTEEAEKKLYGETPVFIWDKTDNSNRPVRGIHNNVIKRWGIFPEILREAFFKSFSKPIMTVDAERQERMMETQWKKVFLAMRNTLAACPHCKDETFIDINTAQTQCMECGKTIPKPNLLKMGTETIVLMNGVKIYASNTKADGNYREITGDVVPDSSKPGMFFIRNLSKDTWYGVTRAGATKNVEPNQAIPVLAGIKIAFQGGKQSEII